MATIQGNIRWADNTQELKKNLLEGIGVIDVMKASVDRTATAMGGQGLFLQANKLTQAIDQLGGVTKLTAAEQDRASATLDKAIEKYKTMGMTAPPAMVELRDAMKGAEEATGGWLPLLQSLGSSWVARIAEGLLLRDAIREVLHWMGDMITALPELAMRGSEVASVQHGFELLAGSTKNADDIMQAMRAGTKNTITDFLLMKDAAHLLSAGVQLTASDFGTLTEAARVLAHRGFGDTTEILNKLSDAMITGRTKTVAKMLGVVDAKGAELEYQTALGTGIDKLTAVGKAEAIRQAILEKLSGLVKGAGDQQVTFAERVEQAKTAIGNFTDSLGVAIATSPVVKTAMDAIGTAFLHTFGANQTQTVQTLIGWINRAAIALVSMAEEGVTAGGFMVKEYFAVYKVIGDVVQVAEIGALGIEKMSLAVAQFGAATSFGDAAKRYAADVERIQGNIASLTASILKRGTALEEADRLQAGVDQKTDAFNKTLEELRAKMEAASRAGVTHTEVVNALGRAHEDATRHTGKLTAAEQEWQKVQDDINSAGTSWVDTLNQINPAVAQWSLELLKSGVALETVRKDQGLTEVQGHALENQLKFLTTTTDLSSKAFSNHGQVLQAIHPRFSTLHGELTGIDETTGLLHATLIDSGTATFAFANQAEYAAKQTENMRQRLAETHVTLSQGLLQDLRQMPSMLASAFTGGGGAMGAVQGLGSMVGSTVGQSVGKGISSAVSGIGSLAGPIGSAIGSLVGPLIGLIANIGGPSKDELAARDTFGKFQQQFGSLQQTIDAVGAAYAKAGKTGVQAQQDLQRALDATHVSASAEAAALATINDVLNGQKQDEADLNTAIQKYKFSIAELGPTMQKQQLDAQANQLMNDWRLLVASGISLTTVNEHMASSVQDYLNTAKLTGQEVPVAMQPIIQKMIDQGLLTDAAGQKITDMKELGISFAESMTAGFNKVVDKLTELIDKISATTGAINAIPTAKTITIDTVYTESHPTPTDTGGGDPYASTGGLVTAHGIQHFAGGGVVLPFAPRGSDTVPAMLTPGEMVLTRRQQASLFRAASGGGGGTQVVDFSAMRAELAALRTQLVNESRRAPERMAIAVAAALNQTRVGRK